MNSTPSRTRKTPTFARRHRRDPDRVLKRIKLPAPVLDDIHGAVPRSPLKPTHTKVLRTAGPQLPSDAPPTQDDRAIRIPCSRARALVPVLPLKISEWIRESRNLPPRHEYARRKVLVRLWSPLNKGHPTVVAFCPPNQREAERLGRLDGRLRTSAPFCQFECKATPPQFGKSRRDRHRSRSAYRVTRLVCFRAPPAKGEPVGVAARLGLRRDMGFLRLVLNRALQAGHGGSSVRYFTRPGKKGTG